jgi:hypothetical protein
MYGSSHALRKPRRVSPVARRGAAAIIAAAGLALLAAACGGSNKVASVRSSSAGGSSNAASSAPSTSSHESNDLRYSQCMRSHGITDSPDPTASGDFAIDSAGPNSDLDRDNPAFQAAEWACQRYTPQPDVTPAQHAQLESAYLSFARCMRSHGVGDFPDPVTGTGGHPGFYLQGGSNSDLNSNNPAFQRGVEACQRILGHEFRFAFTPSGVGKGA